MKEIDLETFIKERSPAMKDFLRSAYKSKMLCGQFIDGFTQIPRIKNPNRSRKQRDSKQRGVKFAYDKYWYLHERYNFFGLLPPN